MPRSLDVLLPLPLGPLRYLAPHTGEVGDSGGAADASGAVGRRVVVPWQGGVRIGLVVGASEVRSAEALELREVIDWLDRRPWVHPRLAADLPAAAAAHAAPAGVLLAGMVAVGLNDPLEHRVRAVPGAADTVRSIDGLGAIDEAWTPAGGLDAAALDVARRQGLVEERVEAVPDTVRVLRFVRPADDELDGAPRAAQRAALAWLEREGPLPSAAELARQADVPPSAARALVTKGYAAYGEAPIPTPLRRGEAPERSVRGDAGVAVELPDLPAGEVLTLYGGRRSDRLDAVAPLLARAVRDGTVPVVLLPEQGLLETTVDALAARLDGAALVAVSGDVSDAERRAVWRHLQAGEPCVLVGTGLALYAPHPAAGPIVVLEAGSGSYKLRSGARPFVPDLALRSAAELGVPAVVADAGLPPEAFERSAPERRIAVPHPRVRLHVSDIASTPGWPLTADLVRVLRQVEARGRQAIVVAPRRGYSAALGCPDCGWVAPCPNCDLPLRFHREGVPLRCHQCGTRQRAPERCPSCDSLDLGAQRGAGTEWVAGAVAEAVPELRVARFDADRRDDLAELEAGAPGVVVGTTALLRHTPLPNVSLVAVTHLDAFLNFGDFRADEESARILLQLPELWRPDGPVPLLLLQTFQPRASVLELLRSDDTAAAVDGHARAVLERRERLGFPPATAMANVQIQARSRGDAERIAADVAQRLRVAGASESAVLGPAPAAVARRRGRYAFHVLVRAATRSRLAELIEAVGSARGGTVRIDVTPRQVEGMLDLA